MTSSSYCSLGKTSLCLWGKESGNQTTSGDSFEKSGPSGHPTPRLPGHVLRAAALGLWQAGLRGAGAFCQMTPQSGSARYTASVWYFCFLFFLSGGYEWHPILTCMSLIFKEVVYTGVTDIYQSLLSGWISRLSNWFLKGSSFNVRSWRFFSTTRIRWYLLYNIHTS